MSHPALLTLKPLLAAAGSPELGPGPRSGVRPAPALNEAVKDLFAGSKLPPSVRECIRSLLLLWHDHLDAAHAIAQGIENRDGSFVHGIVHRREPDFSNAAYWFHRVGAHPCYPKIARRVTAMLDSKNEQALLKELVPEGHWGPLAFVDACERAVDESVPESQVSLLREVQRVEMETLLEHLLGAKD